MAPFPRGADRGYAARRRRRFRGRASRGGLRQCLQVGVRAPVPLWGVPFAVSESQRPDDLVCFVQRRRSGACLALCRGFRHCCVAVSKSRGWGVDVPWLVRWCAGALLGVGVVDGHPRGGAFQRCEGRLVLGAVPLPVARPPERAARVPRPVCSGCGRCGRVGPAPAPQRAPLRAGVARCGGGGRASPGGVPSTVVRGAWCQALSIPRPPVLWSGQPGFRDPCVPGAVDAGVWTQHRPHSVRPCGPALLAVRVAEGRPRGAAFHRCEGRLASGAVPPPAARPLERAARVPRPVCPGCGRCGRVDPAPAPQLAPLRAGVARCEGGGRASPGGVSSTVVRGVRRQALSLPRPSVLWSRQSGFRVPYLPGAVGAGVGAQHWPCNARPCGPVCSPWGWRKGVPGGGAFHHCEGRLVSGAVPPPAARPLERAARVPRPVCPRCGRCGRGDPAPAPRRAPLRAGVARRGVGRRASPGGAFHRCEGRLVSGAVPSPAARPLERAAGVPRPVCPGCGRCVCGDPAPAPQRAPLRAGVARCGGGGRASPGGVFSTVVRGARCQALSLPWPPVLWSGQPGSRDPCVPGAVDTGVRTQHRPPSVRPCGPALLAVGVAEWRPRGGCFPPL